jgi:hypothetical protein
MSTTVTQVGMALGVAVAGVCYRTVLGAAPGEPGVPFAGSATAFAVTAALLALAATATSLLGARLHRLPAEPVPVSEPVSTATAGPAAAPTLQRSPR